MNEEKVKDLLREKGLKVTSQRLMVLNILSAHGDEHLTVEEIYDLAKEESPEIGLATIYRPYRSASGTACDRKGHL